MPPPRRKAATGLLVGGSKPATLIHRLLASCPSVNTRRAYAHGIDKLYTFAAGRPITLTLLLEWRAEMAKTLATASVNRHITAARCLIRQAQLTRAIGVDEAWELLQISGLPYRGARIGNWLTVDQTNKILKVPSGNAARSQRNYCILAILAGCALRVGELSRMTVDKIQLRDGRWIFADIEGKGGRVRSVAIPRWVKDAIDRWRKSAGITSGRLIRQLTLKDGLSTQGIWDIVSKAAAKIGVENFGPHDLRRTCAKLCKAKGRDIEQIQYMLGHASLVTTQRYLGTVQDLQHAVNDDIL
jgi:integrase